MGLNNTAIFDRIRKLIATDRTVSDCMREIIGLCAANVPHADWAALAAIDYNADVESLRGWMPRVFSQQKPTFPIRGIFVGLCNPGTPEGEIWADMGLMATPQYDAADPECGWMFDQQRFYPDDALANSAALRNIYGIAYGSHVFGRKVPGKLKNDAAWPLNLAYGALAVRAMLTGQTNGFVDARSSGIGVAGGFGDGDMITIGELSASGFKVAAA
jgi:hypothetical protein